MKLEFLLIPPWITFRSHLYCLKGVNSLAHTRIPNEAPRQLRQPSWSPVYWLYCTSLMIKSRCFTSHCHKLQPSSKQHVCRSAIPLSSMTHRDGGRPILRLPSSTFNQVSIYTHDYALPNSAYLNCRFHRRVSVLCKNIVIFILRLYIIGIFNPKI